MSLKSFEIGYIRWNDKFSIMGSKTHVQPEEISTISKGHFFTACTLFRNSNSTFSWFSSSFWSGIESTNFIELIKSTLSKKAKDPGPKSGTKPCLAKHTWSSLFKDSQFWPKVRLKSLWILKKWPLKFRFNQDYAKNRG